MSLRRLAARMIAPDDFPASSDAIPSCKLID